MSERFTPIYDRMFDPGHELAKNDPACRRWAFADLLHMARWEDGNRIVGGVVVPLRRGEFVVSLRYLAGRWGWSLKKVRTFMSVLTDENVSKLGTVRETPKGTVYRVVNYEVYANPGHSQGHAKGHDRGTGGAQVGHKEQQGTTGNIKGEARKRAARLPEDWTPTESHQEKATALGIDIASEVDGFRLHAKANGRTQHDWDAAFHNWLRKAVEFGRAKPNGIAHADFVHAELERRQRLESETRAARSQA